MEENQQTLLSRVKSIFIRAKVFINVMGLFIRHGFSSIAVLEELDSRICKLRREVWHLECSRDQKG